VVDMENEESGCRCKDFIVEINGEKIIDVTKILPETLPSGKRILWKEIENDKIEIFVDRHSAGGGNPKPIVIKKFIPVCELLFEGLGLRFGDGIKLQGGVNRIFGFSNINLELHKHFLKFAKECFGLDSTMFRVAITMPPSLKNEQEKIENRISQELNIPRENFFKTRILERRNHPIVDIKITSRLLAMVVQLIFEKLKDIMTAKNFSAAVLRGIIASEGNVKLASNSSRLGEITIAAKDKDKRLFIRKLLENLEILPDKDKEIRGMECVLITGLSNFKIMKKWNLCKLHPEKEATFNLGLNNFKKAEFRKGEGKILILKELAKEPKTTKELQKCLKRASRTVWEHLLILKALKLVESKKVGRNSMWEITENGRAILKDPNALEKLRVSRNSI
jgi:hypothetical protein